MRIKIMVAAHKKFPMPEDSRLYMPVLVGAKRNYIHGIDYQRDDDGENISSKNPNYNELTAVYWAWKNLKNVDAIGLVHYRRIFSSGGKRSLDNALSYEEVISLLKRADVVVPKKRKYYIETNESHYVHAHKDEPLYNTRKVIEKVFPEYLDDFDYVMGKRSAHMFNMFIMKRKIFDEYCDWLFTILKDVEISTNISQYSKEEQRVFGYLSELLLDVWLRKNQINFVESKWIQIGQRKVLRKIYYFIYRKFVKADGNDSVTHF